VRGGGELAVERVRVRVHRCQGRGEGCGVEPVQDEPEHAVARRGAVPGGVAGVAGVRSDVLCVRGGVGVVPCPDEAHRVQLVEGAAVQLAVVLITRVSHRSSGARGGGLVPRRVDALLVAAEAAELRVAVRVVEPRPGDARRQFAALLFVSAREPVEEDLVGGVGADVEDEWVVLQRRESEGGEGEAGGVEQGLREGVDGREGGRERGGEAEAEQVDWGRSRAGG
jgi:hypothetical protein